MLVDADKIRDRLRMFEARARDYGGKLAADGGKYSLNDSWRHEYVANPCLIGAPDDRLAERFRQVFINATELSAQGQIVSLQAGNFMSKFTHLMEEYGGRGGLPVAVVAEARKPVLAYFEHGDPISPRTMI